MSILVELSSRVGDRTHGANWRVAEICAREPARLAEIAAGLVGPDAALAGDCAEVFTTVAQTAPEHVAPFAEVLSGLPGHKTTRVRWEVMHALALVAPLAPDVVAPRLKTLDALLESDKSVIVRDYATTAFANYASTGPQAARDAYPHLRKALLVWEGRHAARALEGLRHVALAIPELVAEIRPVAESYLRDRRGVVNKAAKALLEALAWRCKAQ